MSKRDELRLIERKVSADAPVSYHTRTGENSDSATCMLDFYAHVESAEDELIKRDEESAREQFEKVFNAFLKKIYDGKERSFLRAYLLRKKDVKSIGKDLGVDGFEYLKGIQLKAYKNADYFIKVATLSGWSGATDFVETVLKRLKKIKSKADLDDVIPIHEKERRRIAVKLKCNAEWRKNNREKWLESHRCSVRKWVEKNKENYRAYYNAYKKDWKKRKKNLLKVARKKKSRAEKEYFLRKQELYKVFHAVGLIIDFWIECGKPKKGFLYEIYLRVIRISTKAFQYAEKPNKKIEELNEKIKEIEKMDE